MKRLFCGLFLMCCVFCASAQTVDYEILGFVDANNEIIFDMPMSAASDFEPRLMLKNNGPDVIASSDTLFFDIFFNDNYLTSSYVRGSSLQNILPNQTGFYSLPQPLFTVEQMDQYVITDFRICFEMRISGVTVDPVASNNQACVQVSRPLEVVDNEVTNIKLYPNPTTDVVNLQWDGTNGNCEVAVYDLFGKMLFSQRVDDEHVSLDLATIASGMYLVRVFSDGKTVATEKVVKR